MLASQAQGVAEAYEALFELDPVAEKEEWCRITGVKKA
ncbi:ribosomal protein L11 methylase PrmA [Ewingella americana]